MDDITHGKEGCDDDEALEDERSIRSASGNESDSSDYGKHRQHISERPLTA
jgi:hypothetical protein